MPRAPIPGLSASAPAQNVAIPCPALPLPPAGLHIPSHPLPAPHMLRRAPPLLPAPGGGGDAMPLGRRSPKIPALTGQRRRSPALLACRALLPRSRPAGRPIPHHIRPSLPCICSGAPRPCRQSPPGRGMRAAADRNPGSDSLGPAHGMAGNPCPTEHPRRASGPPAGPFAPYPPMHTRAATRSCRQPPLGWGMQSAPAPILSATRWRSHAPHSAPATLVARRPALPPPILPSLPHT